MKKSVFISVGLGAGPPGAGSVMPWTMPTLPPRRGQEDVWGGPTTNASSLPESNIMNSKTIHSLKVSTLRAKPQTQEKRGVLFPQSWVLHRFSFKIWSTSYKLSEITSSEKVIVYMFFSTPALQQH